MGTPLQDWISNHPIGAEMLWRGAAHHQLSFVRDTLQWLFAVGLPHKVKRDGVAEVISLHRSKSIDLPVYSLVRPGLQIVLRSNFYDWKLSVISDKPIEADFAGLFYTAPPREPEYTGNRLSPCYFEGFPENLVFGHYEETDKCCWSASLSTDYVVHTTVYLILRALGLIKPARYRTRAEHQAELAEERAAWEAEKAERDVKYAALKADARKGE